MAREQLYSVAHPAAEAFWHDWEGRPHCKLDPPTRTYAKLSDFGQKLPACRTPTISWPARSIPGSFIFAVLLRGAARTFFVLTWSDSRRLVGKLVNP